MITKMDAAVNAVIQLFKCLAMEVEKTISAVFYLRVSSFTLKKLGETSARYCKNIMVQTHNS